MKIIHFFLTIVAIAIFNGCSNSENSSDCGDLLIIDQNKYDDISNESTIFVDSPTLMGECLTVTLGYSGCNNGHDIKLITNGFVAESYPVQVFFKFDDLNPQACLAFFTEEFEFDLSPLKDILGTEDKARLIFVQDDKEVLWEL